MNFKTRLIKNRLVFSNFTNYFISYFKEKLKFTAVIS